MCKGIKYLSSLFSDPLPRHTLVIDIVKVSNESDIVANIRSAKSQFFVKFFYESFFRFILLFKSLQYYPKTKIVNNFL
jgi:hypothetical protein